MKHNVIFLDIDGVLNCQVFYEKNSKLKKREPDTEENYYTSQICKERLEWLNQLCHETNSVVVISSTWRLGRTVEDLDILFKACGATFKIIDKTPHTGYERGTEISKWLQDNTEKFFQEKYYNFYRYVIIDDDSDMLLNQQAHFFKVDGYSGLTPNTCYKIKLFLTHQTF